MDVPVIERIALSSLGRISVLIQDWCTTIQFQICAIWFILLPANATIPNTRIVYVS